MIALVRGFVKNALSTVTGRLFGARCRRIAVSGLRERIPRIACRHGEPGPFNPFRKSADGLLAQLFGRCCSIALSVS